MVRETMVWEPEYPLPKLTAEDRQALNEIDINKIIASVVAEMPPEDVTTLREQQKPWKVTDTFGNTIQRYKTKSDALASCIARNLLAREMGLWMRYRVARDQGWDE